MIVTDILGNVLEPVGSVTYDDFDVPDGIDDVLEWANTAERVLLALSIEEERGAPRKRVLKALRAMLPANSLGDDIISDKVVDE